MTTIFPILPFFVIFCILLMFIIRRSNSKQQTEIEDFLKRERESKLVRPVDLSTLPYLNVPIDRFCFGTLKSDEVKKIEDEILAISKKPLLNLSGKTNTELRETYGSPNLEAMQAIGDDFDRITVLICDYAKELMDAGEFSLAITVLEWGIYIKSDVSRNYTYLCDCFKELGQERRIETLREMVEGSEFVMKPVALKHIDEVLTSLTDKPQQIHTPDISDD